MTLDTIRWIIFFVLAFVIIRCGLWIKKQIDEILDIVFPVDNLEEERNVMESTNIIEVTDFIIK